MEYAKLVNGANLILDMSEKPKGIFLSLSLFAVVEVSC